MPTALPYICDLTSYEPGKPIDLVAREYGVAPDQIIKLASNENPLGPSLKALAALQAAVPNVHRYPEQYELLQALAQHLGMGAEFLVLGNGSNDVLDLIARTYLAPGTEAISAQYAFSIYSIVTQSVGAKNVVVPSPNFGHDLTGMLNAITPQTKVIWIANPNNPTGTFVPYGGVKQFLEKIPSEIIVVLDEAYYEYLDAADRVDSTKWLKDHPNLVLVRTFSKIYGLAGLRIGYGITSPDIAELLNRVRQPFNANSLALAAAIAALEDHDFTSLSYQTNQAGCAQLKAGFDKLGLPHLPAYGNFVTVKVPKAQEVYEALLRQAVIVRPLAANSMPDYLRVTVGTTEENTRLLSTLELVLKSD